MNTQAGTDTLGLALCALSDLNADATILSFDGIGAFEHVRQNGFLAKLAVEQDLHALLPFVRMLYSHQSTSV